MKKETFTSVFSELCEKYFFIRDGDSAKRRFENYDVYINLQKSVYGRRFYVNVAILYPELINDEIDFGPSDIFGLKALFNSHVRFRLECLTQSDGVDQNLFDNLTMNKDWVGLKAALEKGLEKLIHLSESGEFRRSNIRNLKENRVINAGIIKEV